MKKLISVIVMLMLLTGASAFGATTFWWTNSATAGDHLWSTGGNWTNDLVDGSAPTSGTTTAINIVITGAIVATNDIATPFYLQSITIAGTSAKTVAGNELTFTNSPFININANAYDSIYNPIVLGDNLTVGGSLSSRTLSMTNVISGAYGLIKTNPGFLSLGSSNTYTGKLTLQGGTLNYISMANAGSACSWGASTGANATIDLYNGTTFTYNGPQVPLSLTDRTLNLASVGAGTVSLSFNSNDAEFRFNGPITATGTGAKTLSVAVGYGSADREKVTFNGAISDVTGDSSPLGLTITFVPQTSGGYLYFNATNTFTGPISVSTTITSEPSTVYVSGAGLLSSGSYTNTITLGAGTVFYYGSSANQTLSGAISGAGKLSKYGMSTLSLTASNSFTGGFTMGTGTVYMTDTYAIGTNDISIYGGSILSTPDQYHYATNLPFTIYGSFTFYNTSGPWTTYFGTGAWTLSNNATVNLTLGQNLTSQNPINLNSYRLSFINTFDAIYIMAAKITGTGGLTLQNNATTGGKSLTVNCSTNDFTGSTILLSSATSQNIITYPLANAGSVSALGAPTGTNSVIQIDNDVIWQLGGTTDRGINLASTNAGTSQITVNSSSGSLVLNGPITATGAGAKTLYLNLPFNNAVTMTINSGIPDISDGSKLTLQFGPGNTDGGNYATLYLTGTNLFTGPIKYTMPGSSGLSFNSALNITGSGVLGGGNYTNTISMSNNTYAIFNYASSVNQTLAGAISGSGRFQKGGASTLTLTAVNTYTGPTVITGGVFTVSSAGQLGSGTYTNYITNTASFVYSSSANQTLSGPIRGAGTLTMSGAGTLSLAASNTYTGITTVNSGVLQLTNDAITATSLLSIGSGAKVSLTYAGTSVVKRVYLNGVDIPNGLWGSERSSAQRTSPYFTGAGVLSVTNSKATNIKIPVELNGLYNSNQTSW